MIAPFYPELRCVQNGTQFGTIPHTNKYKERKVNTMKRSFFILLFLLVLLVLSAQAEVEQVVIPDSPSLDLETLAEARAAMWDNYREEMLNDETLIRETHDHAMTFGDATMRYTVEVFGEKPEEGYPLYIAMHGGGSGDTPDFNDSQWEDMQSYYSSDLECGVYVAVRGVRDTWDTHFNPESYPLYDRLIQYMILTEQVDPNRVYLMGFSAGGDGVYAISARMPDRFAAVNMSSGHPNGISLINLFNLPIQLQAGEFDDAYDRNRVTAEYGLKLDELQNTCGGYEHRTLIHYDRGHNYGDFQREPLDVMRDISAWLNHGDRSHVAIDAYPPDFMDLFTRDPLPLKVIWDLSTRAELRETESFYYLSAPQSTNQGVITVSADGDNRFLVEAEAVNGEFSMLFNEYMVDFSQPVTFDVNGEETTLTLTPDMTILMGTTLDRGDPWYQFEAMVTFKNING